MEKTNLEINGDRTIFITTAELLTVNGDLKL